MKLEIDIKIEGNKAQVTIDRKPKRYKLPFLRRMTLNEIILDHKT